MAARGLSVRVEKSLTRHDDSSLPKAASRFTVFILSDVRLYREGLSWSLAREGSLDAVGSAEPSDATLERLVSLAPDAVILDMAVPDALRIARTLRTGLPRTKIVAFAVSNVDTQIVSCAMAGICGYVHRDGTVDDLVKEVLNAVRGELHCSPRLAALLLEQICTLSCGDSRMKLSECNPGEALQSLTERELEILNYVDKGLSNKEIARELDISSSTVKNHVHNILEKLHVSRRTQALACMRERQIRLVSRAS
jgi:DNA-binding NarL/FixJ family response regulator